MKSMINSFFALVISMLTLLVLSLVSFKGNFHYRHNVTINNDSDTGGLQFFRIRHSIVRRFFPLRSGSGGNDDNGGPDDMRKPPQNLWQLLLAVDFPIKTYGEALEEELRSLAAKQSNFPLFTKHEHQENDDVLSTLSYVSSVAGSENVVGKLNSQESQVLRLRGGGRKKTHKNNCNCGGACNHENMDNMNIEKSFDEDEEFAEEQGESYLQSSFDEDHRDAVDEPTDLQELREMKQFYRSRHDKHINSPNTRQKRRTVHSGTGKIIDPKNVDQTINNNRNCCGQYCVSILERSCVYEARNAFHELSQEEQRKWMVNFFQTAQRYKNGKKVYAYFVRGKEVCQKAWLFAHGISNGRFYYWKNMYEKRGMMNVAHQRIGMIIKGQRAMAGELWFEELVDSLANRMPDVNRKELPACLTIFHIHCMYKEAARRQGNNRPLSYVQFRRMWKRNFPEVIIPKTNRFSKCGVCLLINEHIRATRNKKKRITWTERKQLHMEQQAGERKKYYKHQKKAEARPDKYMSLIIDGMDQGKTHLPHWIQTSKLEGEFAHFQKTHVTGVLSHGHKLPICFLDLMRWPQDANPTINGLISTFRHIIRTRGSLPPILYLQLDNCYRDCKNIYILGFCSLLVKAGVFKKVRLSYLMVGHTHEDIDQMFSRISENLKRTDAVTIDELRGVIHKAYTPTPVTIFRENIYDVKKWLLPNIAKFQHHSHPHAFRFVLNKEGKVEMSYRKWARAGRKEWLPKDVSFVSMCDLPLGKPSVLKPDNRKCPSAEEIENALRHLRLRMNPDQERWWERFAKEEVTKRETWNSMTPKDYLTAGASFDLLKIKFKSCEIEDGEEDEMYQKRNEELEKLLEKRVKFPEVKIIKKAISKGENNITKRRLNTGRRKKQKSSQTTKYKKKKYSRKTENTAST